MCAPSPNSIAYESAVMTTARSWSDPKWPFGFQNDSVRRSLCGGSLLVYATIVSRAHASSASERSDSVVRNVPSRQS